MRKALILALVVLGGCATKRDKVKENNTIRDEQECRSKGGILMQAQYNGPLACVKVGESIPLTGTREVPPVE